MIDEKKLIAKLESWESESKEESGLKEPALLQKVIDEVKRMAVNEEIKQRIEREGVNVMKYRKKPVVIEAFKWTGGPDQTEDPEWIIDAIKKGTVKFSGKGDECRMEIETLEGIHLASVGDYIIKGVEGELYPCKSWIFEQTYEKVEE